MRERDNRIQAIQYDNVALQVQRYVYRGQVEDLIANPHVQRSGDFDTILIIVEKNVCEHVEEHEKARDFPYYMLRCQER